jgi:nucleotide-binding universal stress UspA family protein
MKAILGVDPPNSFRPVLEMFCRLRFRDVEPHLVFSVESVSPDATFPQVLLDHPVALVIRHQEEEGRRTLREAAEELRGRGLEATESLVHGDAVRALRKAADEAGAELIVAGSARKGAFGSLFFGSVSKGLVVDAEQSVLIVKGGAGEGDGPEEGPLTGVFATDHSEYANRCLDRLLAMGPAGLGRIVVLTAQRTNPGFLATFGAGTQAAASRGHDDLLARCAAVCDRLEAICPDCVPRVEEGHPNDVIRECMALEKAHLLILGAQGHGFLNRLSIGSISFHQAVSEPHNVLVLRA